MGQAETLVLASHSSGFLKSYCDKGLVFRDGKIVFNGSIEDAVNFSETLAKRR